MPSWVRSGVLLGPESLPEWGKSHVALPWAIPSGPDQMRLFFSSRDSSGRSHVGAALIACDAGSLRVLEVEADPLLSPGRAGCFDESGCTLSCVVERAGRLFLYYTGWTLGQTVPFYLLAGLAISEDGGQSFTRWSEGPLLPRSSVDPILTASPMVLWGPDLCRMYYVSASSWEPSPQGLRHKYHVRYAESEDGLNWRRNGLVCLDYSTGDEYAFGRPCVERRRGGDYLMYFCSRGESYRLGVARSTDSKVWEREESDLLPGSSASAEAWDREMQAYPQVFERGDFEYMLYNGNGYGSSGIGYASRRLG